MFPKRFGHVATQACRCMHGFRPDAEVVASELPPSFLQVKQSSPALELGELSHYFAGPYLQGKLFEGKDYEEVELGELRTFRQGAVPKCCSLLRCTQARVRASRYECADGTVEVWQHALDLRDLEADEHSASGDELMVLYHYTNELALRDRSAKHWWVSFRDFWPLHVHHFPQPQRVQFQFVRRAACRTSRTSSRLPLNFSAPSPTTVPILGRAFMAPSTNLPPFAANRWCLFFCCQVAFTCSVCQRHSQAWRLRLHILLNNYSRETPWRPGLESFGSQRCVCFLPVCLQRGDAADEESQRVLREWGDANPQGHRAAYCIPILATKQMAYNIFERQTRPG